MDGAFSFRVIMQLFSKTFQSLIQPTSNMLHRSPSPLPPPSTTPYTLLYPRCISPHKAAMLEKKVWSFHLPLRLCYAVLFSWSGSSILVQVEHLVLICWYTLGGSIAKCLHAMLWEKRNTQLCRWAVFHSQNEILASFSPIWLPHLVSIASFLCDSFGILVMHGADDEG